MFCAALILVSLAGIGCDASFTDERPSIESDQGVVDQVVADQAAPIDQRMTDSDALVADAPGTPADTGMVAKVFAEGPFQGRGGYTGMGTAELFVDAKGNKQLRFSASFSTSSVPGPVVLLSSRAAIGTAMTRASSGENTSPRAAAVSPTANRSAIHR